VTVASEEVPAEFVATIVYSVAAKMASGVPEITQVEEFTEAQLGNAVLPDFTPQAVTLAPRLFKVVGETDIAFPKVPDVPVAPVYERSGVFAATVNVTVASLDAPMELDAITVNSVAAKVVVGVPSMEQSEVSRVAQAGSAVVEALIAQFVIVEPRLFNVVGATLIKTPTVPEVPVALAYDNIGARAATSKVTVASADVPTEFDACKVNCVEANEFVGVPEITQVLGFTDAQAGRAVVPDFMAHDETLAPRGFNVEGVMLIAEPKVPELPVELA